MPSTIRLALEHDAAAIAGIYGPACESTTASFEYAAPSTEEIANRIRTITAQFPWLVLEDDGVVVGYAYASRHRERAAYAWSVDTTVYVSSIHRRSGVGRALYTTLFQLLRLQGYFKAYAGITLPNDASTGLHEAVGFTQVGVYEGVGYKYGAWHDVAHYQMALQPERLNPDLPVPVSALAESPGWADAVSRGLEHYRSGANGVDDLAARFMACTLPRAEWTHLAHMAVGTWHVHRYGPDEALARLRVGICRLNESHGTPNTPTSGYHETITCAYVQLLSEFLEDYVPEMPVDDRVAWVIDSPLADRDVLLKFYSRGRLMSTSGRMQWVEPDIAPLRVAAVLAGEDTA